MSQPQNRRPRTHGPEDAPQYASFLLRCWAGEGGRVRARLIEVRSGLSYPLADLAGLPSLVQHLVARAGQATLPDSADGPSLVGGGEEDQP